VALAISDILDAVQSHAAASGLFDRPVGLHEPLNPPGHGLSCAVWPGRILPVRSSGLNTTSALLVCAVRLYSPATQEPQDDIDPNLVAAVDTLCRAYAANFKLGDLVRNVDIFGENGQSLDARDGWLEQAGAVFRVYTINLPLIVDDLWPQAP
jgi:hypothetical protein